MNFSVILPNLRDWLSLIEADIRETTAPGKARPDPEKALYYRTVASTQIYFLLPAVPSTVFSIDTGVRVRGYYY